MAHLYAAGDYMKNFFVFCVALTISACTTTSGVMPAGDGFFTVTTGASPGAGGLSKSQQLAYNEANDFCSKQGKKIVAATETNQPMSFFGDGKTNTSIRFKCE